MSAQCSRPLTAEHQKRLQKLLTQHKMPKFFSSSMSSSQSIPCHMFSSNCHSNDYLHPDCLLCRDPGLMYLMCEFTLCNFHRFHAENRLVRLHDVCKCMHVHDTISSSSGNWYVLSVWDSQEHFSWDLQQVDSQQTHMFCMSLYKAIILRQRVCVCAYLWRVTLSTFRGLAA